MSSRSWIATALVVSTFLATKPAHAQATIEVGARTGYALPLGELSRDSPIIESNTAGNVPLWLDLGARIGDSLFVGAFAQYGIGIVAGSFAGECDATGASCSTRDVRVGVEALYHFGERERTDPWVGAGAGYEWMSFGGTVSGGGQELTYGTVYRGFELLNLQAGVDFPLAERWTLGPFTALALGRYTSATQSCSGDCGAGKTLSSGIASPAFHEWLFLGARGGLRF